MVEPCPRPKSIYTQLNSSERLTGLQHSSSSTYTIPHLVRTSCSEKLYLAQNSQPSTHSFFELSRHRAHRTKSAPWFRVRLPGPFSDYYVVWGLTAAAFVSGQCVVPSGLPTWYVFDGCQTASSPTSDVTSPSTNAFIRG